MNTKTKLSVSDRESNLAIEVNHGKRVLNLGMDTHFRQVTAGMQEDGGRIKAAGKMSYPRHPSRLRRAPAIYSVARLSQFRCALEGVTDFGV
jgi:hypothetical protein